MLELVTSEALIAELAGILGRTKFAAKLEQKNLSAAEIVSRYREIAETIEATPVEEARLRDPDDAAVLACALAARAEAIVRAEQWLSQRELVHARTSDIAPNVMRITKRPECRL